jgi:chemotaxis protein CheD
MTNSAEEGACKEFYLHPGMVLVDREPCEVTTVLGSCVSVCLWDSALAIGGINHYLLPLWNGDGLPSMRYGNIAVRRLIEKFLVLGCERKNLRAKIFGGASMIDATNMIFNVGGRNIILAEDMLAEERIRIIGKDVGGNSGRKIIFNTHTGVVRLKKLSSNGKRKSSQSPLETIMLQVL